jgi:phosphohistidine phosphatase
VCHGGGHAVPTLHLLRHAKSSWGDLATDDHDRPLAPRGQEAARRIAGHMRSTGIAPALVLCSAARRTVETLELIRAALPKGAQVMVEEGIYLAGSSRLLQRLHAVPAAVPSVLLIGHNPGMHDLALTLARGGGALLERLGAGFPTGALATLEIHRSGWQGLREGDAELVGFVVPRELR